MTTKTNNNQSPTKNVDAVDLSTALLIIGKSLESQPIKTSVPIERKFKSEKEFYELVVENSNMLFGKNTMLIDATKSSLQCHVLLDFNDAENQKFHFVDITLSKQNFWELFVRITSLFTLLNFPDYQNRLIEVLLGIISENKPLKKGLNLLVGEDIAEYFKMLLINKPFILLLTDQERPELLEITMTYSNNWGRFVKPILLKKYDDGGILFCAMIPAFADIDFRIKKEKVEKISNVKTKKSTEADHLENISDVIKSVYEKVKTELLKEDSAIEFNAKQYYVALRKNKNLAFFHIKKKSISLVVMCPESETKKQIKHHEVKTLTEKVQQFWNGASCTIIINSMDKLDEVINLLNKLVAKS